MINCLTPFSNLFSILLMTPLSSSSAWLLALNILIHAYWLAVSTTVRKYFAPPNDVGLKAPTTSADTSSPGVSVLSLFFEKTCLVCFPSLHELHSSCPPGCPSLLCSSIVIWHVFVLRFRFGNGNLFLITPSNSFLPLTVTSN